MEKENNNEVTRITLATFLLVIVFSSFFWNNLKPVLYCAENDTQGTLNYFGLSALAVSILLLFYLFLIAISFISYSDPPRSVLSKIAKFVTAICSALAKLYYNLAMVTAIIYFLAWVFFLSPAKNYWFFPLISFVIVGILAYWQYYSKPK